MPAWNPFGDAKGKYGGWTDPLKKPSPAEQVENPWQKQYTDLLSGLQNRYSGQYDQMANKAMQLGNVDYTGYLTRQAQQGYEDQVKRYQANLRNMGMPELYLKEDVQRDFAKRRQDMMTDAAMQGANMKRAAYETAMGMLRGSSGADLDAMLARLSAIQGGSGNYNDFMRMLLPLLEKLGMWSGNRGGGNAPTYYTPGG